MLKHNIIAIISAIAAVAFTIYISMDTFIASEVYVKVEQPVSTSENTSENISESIAASTKDDSSYIDENIKITMTTYREHDTDIYVADIVLSSPEYLKTALAGNAYGKNITDATSTIAKENSAILAINGDYYGVQENGYVIRNGVIYRNSAKDDQEDLVIYEDGSFEIINEDNITAEELLEKGAYNLLCFGPGLIEDGEITVSETDEVDKAMTSNPRTAIGRIDDCHYVFVVADGRTSSSEGLSLYELAGFMQDLGVKTAYNLDGGGSSTLYFNGKVINNPSSGSKHKSRKSKSNSSGSAERSVSDIVYIGY